MYSLIALHVKWSDITHCKRHFNKLAFEFMTQEEHTLEQESSHISSKKYFDRGYAVEFHSWLY